MILFAPWWSATARASTKARWYGASVLLGVRRRRGVIALALGNTGRDSWRARTSGNAIFVRQTVGRVAKSFAHARPIWWYFMVLPLMALPWTLSLRAPWSAWRDGFAATRAARFGIAWFLPALVIFCFFSGKQPHYLLPLLPGLALYLAHVLRKWKERASADVGSAHCCWRSASCCCSRPPYHRHTTQRPCRG